MDWSACLEEGEIIRWEGRPAPRCFTFRNWRHSVFGILLLLLTVFWEMVGLQLEAVYHSEWLGWIPIPFVLLALYLSVGHLLFARLEWDKVFFAITDRRLLSQRGLFRQRVETLRLDELRFFQLRPLGEELGSFRITGGEPPRSVLLPCVEYPGRISSLLESAIRRNGFIAVGDDQDKGGDPEFPRP